MPIYAYRCAACGHTKDVLQKVSDPLLTECPLCGAPRFEKQVTAAGFQLKGSGWYATDFRGDGKTAKPAEDASAPKPDAAGGPAAEPAAATAAEPKAGAAKSPEPAAAAPAAPAVPPPASTS